MATSPKGSQISEISVWDKLDSFLTNQMQQVKQLMQETNNKVAEIDLGTGDSSSDKDETQSSQVEELPKDYLDESASVLMDKVNQELDQIAANLNQQIDAIKEKNKL